MNVREPQAGVGDLGDRTACPAQGHLGCPALLGAELLLAAPARAALQPASLSKAALQGFLSGILVSILTCWEGAHLCEAEWKSGIDVT